MFKTEKGQFILSYVTAALFILLIFNSSIQISNIQSNIYLFITLATVFNAGIQTQKYFQSKGSR